ncbi:MAG: hypothetical protein Ct9H300mP11_10910 [Chloroflexota bacterium]|nr:MAG: hypothetical protein Ct9H300mP11_10910 [Chloroflexota bacterium]
MNTDIPGLYFKHVDMDSSAVKTLGYMWFRKFSADLRQPLYRLGSFREWDTVISLINQNLIGAQTRINCGGHYAVSYFITSHT